MAEQIEQMGGQIENYQKVSFFLLCRSKFYTYMWELHVNNGYLHICCDQQLEELQDKYVGQVRECSDLTTKLDITEVYDTLFGLNVGLYDYINML